MTNLTNKLALGALTAICCLGASPAARAHGAEHEFQMMDTNGDKKISADEHAAGAKMMFEKMDADHDGKVTAAEMTAFKQEKQEKEALAGRAEKTPGMSAAEKIKVIDTDGDGALTAAEHANGSKKMFDMMDTDHDGFLTKAELEAGHAKLMSKGAAKKEAK